MALAKNLSTSQYDSVCETKNTSPVDTGALQWLRRIRPLTSEGNAYLYQQREKEKRAGQLLENIQVKREALSRIELARQKITTRR